MNTATGGERATPAILFVVRHQYRGLPFSAAVVLLPCCGLLRVAAGEHTGAPSSFLLSFRGEEEGGGILPSLPLSEEMSEIMKREEREES